MHMFALALTYVLVHGSQSIMSGPDVSLDRALAKRATYGNEFIWFRDHGKDYVIRDAATLDRVLHLFDAEHAFDPDAERIERELRPLEKRESELDEEIDALTDRDEGPALTAAEEQKLDRLQKEMDALHPKMRALERQEAEIDRKRDAAEAEAERRMVPILEEAVQKGVAVNVR
jgi:hypothetical protein